MHVNLFLRFAAMRSLLIVVASLELLSPVKATIPPKLALSTSDPICPDKIEPPPTCAHQSVGNCPSDPIAYNSNCTTIQLPAFPCFSELLVNKTCYCLGLDEKGCSGCSSIRDRARYLYWLHDTCSDEPGWAGLSANWTNEIPKQVFLDVGWSQNDKSTMYWAASPCYGLQPCYTTYWSGIPEAVYSICTSSTWEPFIYNTSNRLLFENPGSYRLGNGLDIYLDQSAFCNQSLFSSLEAPQNCAMSDIDLTNFTIGASNLCDPVESGWSANWKESLAILNSSYRANSSINWPSCLGDHGCGTSLGQKKTDCTKNKALCVLDATGNCTSSAIATNISCFCNSVSYETTCQTNCKLSWEREQNLLWMNSTCSSVSGWAGLPQSWEALLIVQEPELLPWSSHVQITEDLTAHSNAATQGKPNQHCPSTSSKLGAFAAANIAMALLVPILGRRDVIKKLTFRLCGTRGSRMWLFTGPFTVALHLASNAIGAILIKTTPGFQGVNIGHLVLLWCTRPRVAWMIVGILERESTEAIYFSVVSSTLLAEAFLQLLGGYYMGTAANYARRQKFYVHGRLSNTRGGSEALLMYAGPLMWLIFMTFAIATCLWALLDMNNFVAAIASTIRGLDREARKHATAAGKQWDDLSVKIGVLTDPLTDPALLDLGQLGTDVHSAAESSFKDLSQNWNRLYEYVTDDKTTCIKAGKMLRKQMKKMKKKKAGHDTFLTELLQQKALTAQKTWDRTPDLQLQELNTQYQVRGFATLVKSWKETLDDHRSQTQYSLTELYCRLYFISFRIAQPRQTFRADAFVEFLQCELKKLGQDLVRHQGDVEEELQLYEDHTAVKDLIELPYTADFIARMESGSGHNPPEAELRWFVDSVNRKNMTLRELKRLQDSVDSVELASSAWSAENALLLEIWQKMKTSRERDIAQREQGPNSKLRKIAWRTFLGMIGVWIAQWLWWVGYIEVAGDKYCPPKLASIAALWTVFSVFGVILGGGL